MSDIRYIQLKTPDDTSCITFSVARYLTIALPELSPSYQETSLHLQVRWSLDITSEPLEAVDYFDTGLRDDDNARAELFTGNTWIPMPSTGFPQTYANCRVLFDTKDINPDSYIYYSWYYVKNGVMVHVTPWASTKLTATTGIVKHSELQDRDIPDQHPISSITGLEQALANAGAVASDYQEVQIKTDADMADINVAVGKIITFVGYSTGDTDGKLVLRYKTHEGVYGTLADKVGASLVGDNLIISDKEQTGEPDEVVESTVEGTSLMLNSSNIVVTDTDLVLNDVGCTVTENNLTLPSI